MAIGQPEKTIMLIFVYNKMRKSITLSDFLRTQGRGNEKTNYNTLINKGMIYTLTAIAVLLVLLFLFWKKGIQLIAEHKATKDLERRLFPNGEEQKQKVLEIMGNITSDRFSESLMMDYFLKIKGLQIINMNDPVDFWTKKYLMTPTKMRLNYFEQVKFYETFLNYPDDLKKIIIQADDESPDEEVDSPIIFSEDSLSKKFA